MLRRVSLTCFPCGREAQRLSGLREALQLQGASTLRTLPPSSCCWAEILAGVFEIADTFKPCSIRAARVTLARMVSAIQVYPYLARLWSPGDWSSAG
jgi:hypothetical protein